MKEKNAFEFDAGYLSQKYESYVSQIEAHIPGWHSGRLAMHLKSKILDPNASSSMNKQ